MLWRAVFVLVLFGVPVGAQTTAQIESAIRVGMRGDIDFFSPSCDTENKWATAFFGEPPERVFRVQGMPPLANVAFYASNSFGRVYQPPPEATDPVIVEMMADAHTFWVLVQVDGRTSIDHIVLRHSSETAHATEIRALTRGVAAAFASTDVIALAKKDDVEVIVITPTGEQKCKLDDTRILRGYGLTSR